MVEVSRASKETQSKSVVYNYGLNYILKISLLAENKNIVELARNKSCIRLENNILLFLHSEEEVKGIINKLVNNAIPCKIEVYRVDRSGISYRIYSINNYSELLNKIINREGRRLAIFTITLTKPVHECLKDMKKRDFPVFLITFIKYYSKFLKTIERYIKETLKATEVIVSNTIDKFIAIAPIKNYETVINVYDDIVNACRDIHIDCINVSVIVTNSVCPFLRIGGTIDKNTFSWMEGGSMYSLSDDDVKLIRNLISDLKSSGISKHILCNIRNKCGKMGREELKLYIESLYTAGKLKSGNLTRKLNYLIDYFYGKYGENWKDKFRYSLKLVANFAIKDRR